MIPTMLLAASEPNPAQVSNDHFGILLGAIGVMFTALCTLAGIVVPLLIKTRQAAAVASDQTANNHDSNLRDDLDGKHDENGRKLDWLIESVRGLTVDVRNLYTRDQQHEDDIRRLTDTVEGRPE